MTKVERITRFQTYLNDDLIPTFGKYMLKITLALLIYFVVSKIINRLIRVAVKKLSARNFDRTAVIFLGNTFRVILKVLLVIALLTNLGVTSATILAAFGSVTVGIGLALQGGMANFAGGVLITFTKPFEIGDYIIEVGEKNEGTVRKIAMFYTTLQTADDHTVTIPNQMLTNSSVINLTKAGTRRLTIVVGISYRDSIDQAKTILSDLIREEARILKDRPIDIYVDELAASSVNLGLHAYVKAEDYFKVKWDLNEKIKKSFDQKGIRIPYQQVDVHVNANVSEERS